MKPDYPYNLIRALYGVKKEDDTYTQTTYFKGLHEQIQTLREQEQEILCLRYQKGFTQKETMKQCGVTYAQMERPLRKLRHPSRRKHYQAVPFIELEKLQIAYQSLSEEHQALQSSLRIIGERDLDPRQLIQLASILQVPPLKVPIGELSINVRSYNALTRAGIWTIEDLIVTSETELRNLRNIGKKSLEDIQTALRQYVLFPDTSHRTSEEMGCRWVAKKDNLIEIDVIKKEE